MKISCVVNAYVSRWHIFTASSIEPIFVFVFVFVFDVVFIFVFVCVLVLLLVITLGEKILRCQRQRPKVAYIFTGGISGGISTMHISTIHNTLVAYLHSTSRFFTWKPPWPCLASSCLPLKGGNANVFYVCTFATLAPLAFDIFRH